MTYRKPLILLAVLAALSAGGVTLAVAQEQKPGPMRLDTNGDGVIDRQEAAADPRLAQRFDELDANKDGKLSRDEMRRGHERGNDHQRMGRGEHGQRGGGLPGAGGGFFMAMMDTDHDGRISAAEYQAAFSRMDVNKDGFIDQADRQARAKQRREEWFRKVDTDHDGKLSQAELDAARAQHEAGPHGPRPPAPPKAK